MPNPQEHRPSDVEADRCTCPACTSPFVTSKHAGTTIGTGRYHGLNRGPSALPRGPVQCEAGALDPIDGAAMAAIEGRR